MAENERTQNDSIRLKVAEAHQINVGKGIARISHVYMQKLNLGENDIVEIQGKKVTAAIPVPAHPTDEGLDIVRIDGLIRSNARVGIGEYVEIAKANWQPARRVVLAPARKELHLSGSGEALKPTLLHRPLVQDDLISTTVYHRRQGLPEEPVFSDVFRQFFESPAFGLMEIRLVVVSTQPKGIVRVTQETEIELQPEYAPTERRQIPTVTYDDLGGIKGVIQRVREMIELPLKHPELFERLGIDPPKGILLYGPPGTGKTLLAKAVANESDAYFTSINGPEIMGRFYGESEERLRQVFQEAEKNAPAIVFIDEIDSIAPKRGEVTGEVERRVVAQLLTLMDGLKERRQVIVIGATNRLDAVDPALRRPGRFDREINIGTPDLNGRIEILQIHTRGMPLASDGSNMERIAEITHGFTGSDIAALCKEAAMVAMRRVLPEINLEERAIPREVLDKLTVTWDDFSAALKEVQPSALREIMVEVPRVNWEDVGGMEDVKQALREMVELPLTNPDAFTRVGIRPPKGVLLYGPPGTGKTLVAKAVANESNANFLSAKGSDLLSKWYGESEKRISEFFNRARQVAPAVIFFDELDSLAPVRGGIGDSRVTERVVNQILAEMDGLEELRGVAIIGATNRPDMIDPALLRPGRFDEIVFVPVPNKEARLEIFKSHTREMTLDSDVSLEKLAEMTERYTGADIAAVCMKAGIYAIREDINAQKVSMKHFQKAVEDVIPSVTEEVEREYEKMAKRVKQQISAIGFSPTTVEKGFSRSATG